MRRIRIPIHCVVMIIKCVNIFEVLGPVPITKKELNKNSCHYINTHTDMPFYVFPIPAEMHTTL